MPKEIDGITYYTTDEFYKTADDVNQIVQDRLARDRQERPGKPDDYDQIKSEHATLKSQVEGFDALVEQERQKAADEAKSSLAPDLVKERIRTLAAQKRFRDPEDAIAQYGEVKDLWKDGEVDASAIESRLSEIATQKSYLIATPGTPTPTPGDAGIGSGGGDPAPSVQPGTSRLAAAYENNK